MDTQNKKVIIGFIEEIWNKNEFAKLNLYLDSSFIDHSLPQGFGYDKESTKKWIEETGKAFEHQTIIEEILGEDDKVIIKVYMRLKHIGTWRGIDPTFSEINTNGYRLFKLNNNKIVEHWGMIDGNAIENQLKGSSHGCKIQR